jgi:hypothetical protein
MSTWPGPGSGSGNSTGRNGARCLSKTIARIGPV